MIILFYKYINIENPKNILRWLTVICNQLGLKGRLILANEGINGTLGGQENLLKRYIQLMNEHPLFGGIDFKTSDGNENYFPRLRIVIKEEITRMGVDPKKITALQGGKHLTPKEAHELLQNPPENLIILDGRNEYEARIGKFKDAIVPPINIFREFPEYIDKNQELFRDKKVFMYCTGGIRCERASAYLKSKNVAEEVYQLEGGIHRYGEQYPDGFFRGKNYVFDDRIAVTINNDILSNCLFCDTKCADFTNCINAKCNEQYICCSSCIEKSMNCCNKTCYNLVKEKQVPIRIKFRNQNKEINK